jgi:hypothetical protein
MSAAGAHCSVSPHPPLRIHFLLVFLSFIHKYPKRKVYSNSIYNVVFCLCCAPGSRIEEEQGYNEAEMSYVKQGEEALQKSISILGDQDGWTTEIIAVSMEI